MGACSMISLHARQTLPPRTLDLCTLCPCMCVCVCASCGLCGVSCLLSALLTGGNLHPNPHRNLLPGPPNIDAFGKEFPAYVNVSTRRHVDKNRSGKCSPPVGAVAADRVSPTYFFPLPHFPISILSPFSH